MVLNGRVFINGKKASIGDKADAINDCITIDDTALNSNVTNLYIMLNKPLGYVTTMKDEKNRKTVIDLIQGLNCRIYPVGRLDINSEGLLILTNDGRFAHNIMHPSKEVEKVYEVHVRGDIEHALYTLQKPMKIDTRDIQAKSVKLSSHKGKIGVLQIGIVQGVNRQIRKMCAACGLTVLALKRISLGEIVLGELPRGQWRYLTGDETAYFL